MNIAVAIRPDYNNVVDECIIEGFKSLEELSELAKNSKVKDELNVFNSIHREITHLVNGGVIDYFRFNVNLTYSVEYNNIENVETDNTSLMKYSREGTLVSTTKVRDNEETNICTHSDTINNLYLDLSLYSDENGENDPHLLFKIYTGILENIPDIMPLLQTEESIEFTVNI